MDCSTLGFPVLHYVPEFAQIHAHRVVMLSAHLILCLPLPGPGELVTVETDQPCKSQNLSFLPEGHRWCLMHIPEVVCRC